ncbi:hypothetical protein BH20ACI2_BH20ACI2_10510 [soil metagenome]
MTIYLSVAAQISGGVGAVAAGAFFLLAAAVAFIAFKMLKKTVKMAFRIVVLVLILGIAAAGSIALWALSSGGSSKPVQRPSRTR